MKIHIVQKGDTLWKIAKKYGVDFDELKKMNAQLSNPEMIMPGMKIKIPTTGGTVKKEMHTGMKEAPIAVHPYQQIPQPKLPVQKEMPIQKEAPKAVPHKEMPVKEKVVEKKETIYKPIMPQPVVPEIDIHNYYVTNMAEIETHTQAPPQPQPVYHHHESESSSSSGHYTMPVQEECYEMYAPIYPCPMPIQDCGCVGPVMQHGFAPYPYSYAAPFQGVPYQMPVMAPMPGYPTQQAPVWQQPQTLAPSHEWEEESSSSSYPYGHHMQGSTMQNPSAQPYWGMQGPVYGANPESSAYMPQYAPQPQNFPGYAQYPYQPYAMPQPYSYGMPAQQQYDRNPDASGEED